MKEEYNIDREMLFFRYCNGRATALEREQVEALMAESSEIAEELKALQNAVDVRKQINELESYDIPLGYNRVQNIVQRKKRKRIFITSLSRIAAILAIPLLISTVVLSYKISGQSSQEVSYTEVVSAPGLVSKFELPDKSRVWLNSNSILRYPNQFSGSEREVELEGEAYFEVRSDESHPFYVKTNSGARVMAYGTRFNVRAEEDILETVLAEGKTALYHSNNLLKQMTPGELAVFNYETGELNIKEVNLMEKLAWKDGKIIFRNAPLDEVFRQLERRYNVDIVLHDEYHQSDKYSPRVTFTDETIHQILYYLEIAAPIEWKISTPVQNDDSTLTRQRIDVWLKKK